MGWEREFRRSHLLQPGYQRYYGPLRHRTSAADRALREGFEVGTVWRISSREHPVDQGRGLREQVLRFLGPVVQNLGRTSRTEAAAAEPSSRLSSMVDNGSDDLHTVSSSATSAMSGRAVVFAVLRLITSSYFVCACTGRSLDLLLPCASPLLCFVSGSPWPPPRNCAIAGSSRTRFRRALRVSSPTTARPSAVNARPSGLPSRSPSRHASRSPVVPRPPRAHRAAQSWKTCH